MDRHTHIDIQVVLETVFLFIPHFFESRWIAVLNGNVKIFGQSLVRLFLNSYGIQSDIRSFFTELKRRSDISGIKLKKWTLTDFKYLSSSKKDLLGS